MSHDSALMPLEKEFTRAFFGPTSERTNTTWTPIVNVYESGEAYRIEMELPGISKADVQVKCEDDLLVIQGERKRPELSEHVKAWKEERTFGRFTRTFRLTKDIDVEGIEAEMQNGILVLDIKKSAKAQARMIEIKGE